MILALGSIWFVAPDRKVVLSARLHRLSVRRNGAFVVLQHTSDSIRVAGQNEGISVHQTSEILPGIIPLGVCIRTV